MSGRRHVFLSSDKSPAQAPCPWLRRVQHGPKAREHCSSLIPSPVSSPNSTTTCAGDFTVRRDREWRRRRHRFGCIRMRFRNACSNCGIAGTAGRSPYQRIHPLIGQLGARADSILRHLHFVHRRAWARWCRQNPGMRSTILLRCSIFSPISRASSGARVFQPEISNPAVIQHLHHREWIADFMRHLRRQQSERGQLFVLPHLFLRIHQTLVSRAFSIAMAESSAKAAGMRSLRKICMQRGGVDVERADGFAGKTAVAH